MNTTVKYIILTALRDWLFVGLFIVVAAAIGISYFLGSTALVEQQQMTISYIASSTRVIILIGLIVFICFHVRRSFENREIEVLITRPISRNAFVFAYWLGFAVLSTLFIVPIAILIGLIMDVDRMGLIYWTASMLCEAYLIVAFSLATSLMLRSAVASVLFSFAFYFISRLMGFFVVFVDKPVKGDANITSVSWIMDSVLLTTSMVLPRLDLFSNSKWLIYGASSDRNIWLFEYFPMFLGQSLVYIPLIIAIAMYDFRRKQF